MAFPCMEKQQFDWITLVRPQVPERRLQGISICRKPLPRLGPGAWCILRESGLLIARLPPAAPMALAADEVTPAGAKISYQGG